MKSVSSNTLQQFQVMHCPNFKLSLAVVKKEISESPIQNNYNLVVQTTTYNHSKHDSEKTT